jgi:hypothetical protein
MSSENGINAAISKALTSTQPTDQPKNREWLILAATLKKTSSTEERLKLLP